MTDAEFEKAFEAEYENHVALGDWRKCVEIARWAREFTRKEMQVNWDKWNTIEKAERDLLASPEIKGLVEALKLQQRCNNNVNAIWRDNETRMRGDLDLLNKAHDATTTALAAFHARFGRADEGE